MILTENCSKGWNPCRITVAMATKIKKSFCQKQQILSGRNVCLVSDPSIPGLGYVQTPDRTGSGSITGSDRIGPGFLCYGHFFFDILFFMHSWKRFTAYKTICTSHLHSNIKKKNGPNITPPIYIYSQTANVGYARSL